MAKNDIIKECERIINNKYAKNKKSSYAKNCVYLLIALAAIIKLIYSCI